MMVKSAKRKIRRHGAAPANWQWREGRPRWIPSPTLRAAGWRGADLKDARGAWLGEGASIDRARAVNSAVAAWRAGAAVGEGLAAFAPASAHAAGAPREGARAIGTLLDAFLASPELGRKAPATAKTYRNRLSRLVDVLAGYVQPLPPSASPAARAAYARARAEVRAEPIDTFDPPPFGDPSDPVLYAAYWKLHGEVGPHMASGVLAAASAWLQWCVERRRAVRLNAARLVTRETPPGRIRVATWDEVRALVRAADALGLASVGDAVVLGVDLSWSQCDRLALTWDRVREGRAWTHRQKTGRLGGTPFLDLGLKRLAEIRERQRAMAAQPTHVLWREDTGAPWAGRAYSGAFARVRAAAVLELASLADLRDQDLRDTAFTLGRRAGLNDDQTASRTLQSRKRVAQLGDAHYGEIGEEIADQGRDKLNLYMRERGLAL